MPDSASPSVGNRSIGADSSADAKQEARDAWNADSAFWDERMAEGNEFFRTLIWPAVERLLGRPGVVPLNRARAPSAKF